MGNLEISARKRRRRENIQSAVLGTVAVAGILAVTMLAPGIFAALPHIMGKKRYKLAFQAKTAMQRLKIKGHIRFVERNGIRYAEITDEGRRVLVLERARTEQPAAKKRRWDRRYRLVMFDIPQKRKGTRDRLRRMMREFGFLRIQDSVWLSPYDCEDLVALVKAELKLGRDVIYVLVESMERDRWIREHFKLPAG